MTSTAMAQSTGTNGVGAASRAARQLSVSASGIAIVLLSMEFLSRTDAIPRRYFPPPIEIGAELIRGLGEAGYWRSIWYTTHGWATGLALAASIAIPIGMALGASPIAYRSLKTVIEFLRPIPSVALIPLAVLLFGTGHSMKVFLTVFASVWPILFHTMYGVRDTDPTLRDTARVYQLSRFERACKIALPSAAPYIATGIRISSAIALILAVTAELVVGAAGIGRAIFMAQSAGAVHRMYALIVTAGMLGWSVNYLFYRGERFLLRRHPSHRGDS